MDKRAKLAVLAISLGGMMSIGGVQSAVYAEAPSHTYDEATKTDTFINAGISKDRHMNAAFVDTYNEPDHDLVIKWVNEGHPVDGNPIRNGDATAKNITIDANYTIPISVDTLLEGESQK